ncbi:MAG TPA: oligosaccharide flippase family protein [Pyrinomonadaceae bacterium]
MSRTKKFLGGIGFGYAGQVLTMAVGLLITPYLLRRIGQHDYGLWLVGTQVMAYLALMDLGLIALLPRETALATGRAEKLEEATDLPLLVGQTVRLVAWQVPLVLLAALVAWSMLAAAWPELREPIGVVLLSFVLTFPLRLFGAVLQGLQDLAFIAGAGIASYLVGTAITVALVAAGWGLYALAAGWVAQQVFVPVVCLFRLRARFPTVLPRGLPKLPWPAARSRLTQGFWVSLTQIAQVLWSGTDILIIGKLFGPAAVVPYVCTGKMIGVLANQPYVLIAAAAPAISQMRVAESRARVSEVCVALGQAMLMLSGAVVCVVLAVNEGFVARWVGAAQYGGFWLTALILLSMLLRHWSLTVAHSLLCFGYERRLCVTGLLDGLVSTCGVVLFLWLYGLPGAPLGMVIATCAVSLPLNLSALAAESGRTRWEMVRPLVPWLVRFVPLAAGAGALARVWTPEGFILIGVTAAAVALVYVAVMLPVALRAPLGVYVRPRLHPLRARFFRVTRFNDAA